MSVELESVERLLAMTGLNASDKITLIKQVVIGGYYILAGEQIWGLGSSLFKSIQTTSDGVYISHFTVSPDGTRTPTGETIFNGIDGTFNYDYLVNGESSYYIKIKGDSKYYNSLKDNVFAAMHHAKYEPNTELNKFEMNLTIRICQSKLEGVRSVNLTSIPLYQYFTSWVACFAKNSEYKITHEDGIDFLEW